MHLHIISCIFFSKTDNLLETLMRRNMNKRLGSTYDKNEVEFQRTGRNKSTQIDNGYINGGEYRKKFDSLSDSKELNRLVYQLAKKMLEHRAGTEYEDMYWIDLDTLTVYYASRDAGNF